MPGTLGVVLQLTPDTYIDGDMPLPDGSLGWSLDLVGQPGADVGVTLTSLDPEVLERLYEVVGRLRDQRAAHLAQLDDDGVAWRRRLQVVGTEDEACRRHPSYAGSPA